MPQSSPTTLNEKTRANLPLVSIGALVITVAVATWHIQAMYGSFVNRMDRMELSISDAGKDRWALTAMTEWCFQAAQKNPGFECPSPREIVRLLRQR